MANELSSQTRLTNRFLKNIEQWNEREVVIQSRESKDVHK